MNKIRVKQIEDIDTNDTYLDSDLKITTLVGEVKQFDSGRNYATISATKDGGSKKTVQEVLEEIFSKDKNPSVTTPTSVIVIKANGNGVTSDTYLEVGIELIIVPSLTFNPGSYEFGPATDCAPSNPTVFLMDNNTQVEKINLEADHKDQFDPYTLQDNSVLSVKGSCAYGNGAIPLSQLGNNVPSLAISAGNTPQVVSKAIRAFRPYFYGTDTSTAAVDSAKVRSLTASTSPVTAGKVLNIAATATTKRIIVAVPTSANRTLSAIMTSALNAPITSEFVKTTLQVHGAAGYTAASYDVWVYSSNFDGSERIQVTLN